MKKSKKKQKRSLLRKIVNFFILFFATIALLLLIFMIVAQTKYFRDFLKNKIVENVNENLKGTFNIEEIGGTVLTSLIIKDVSLVNNSDTVISAKQIKVKISPHKLFFKIIYFREVELTNVSLSDKENAEGKFSLSDLFASDTTKNKEEEENSAPFPFIIQVNNLYVKKLNYLHQEYKYRNSSEKYKLINSEDLKMENLNLEAKAIVNLPGSTINLIVKNLSVEPNFQNFDLNHLSGRVTLTEKFAEVSNLHIITGTTDLDLSARLDSLNLLGGTELKDFNEYPLTLNLDVKNFNFDDLSSFIESTDLLKGNLAFGLNAKGQFGNFNIDNFNLAFGNSELNISGKLKNLHTPDKLFIDMEVKNSSVYLEDARLLLPTVAIPSYKYLDLKNFDLTFKGEPTDFYYKIKSELSKGNIFSEGKLNLKPELIEYDVNYKSENINLFSVVGMNTNLSSSGFIKGKGISPYNMENIIKVKANNSSVNNLPVDSLSFNLKSQNKFFNFNLGAKLAKSNFNLNGNIDLGKGENELYDLSARIKNLNLANFTKDTTNESDLNFTFKLSGENLNPDSTRGRIILALEKSVYNGNSIDYTDIDVTIARNIAGEDSIKMISDFLDFKIFGNFSLVEASKIIGYQAKTISQIINKKAEELNPAGMVAYHKNKEEAKLKQEDFVRQNLKLDYSFKFKDFNLIAMLTEIKNIDIEGEGTGYIKNDSSNFVVNTNLEIERLAVLGELPLYLSGTELKLNFSRNHHTLEFNDLFGTLSINGKRFYAGTTINNFSADLVFNQSKLFFTTYTEIDTLIKSELEGNVSLAKEKNVIALDNIWLNYGGLAWESDTTITISATPENYNIFNLVLRNNEAYIKLNGSLYKDEKIEAHAEFENFNQKILKHYIPAFAQSDIKTKANITAELSGTLKAPIITMDTKLDSIYFEDADLGKMISKINYKEKKLTGNISFIDSVSTKETPKLSIDAEVLADLSLQEVNKRLIGNNPLNIKIFSKQFNVGTFGNTLPIIKNQKGRLDAELFVKGSPEKLSYKGFVKLENGRFTARINNIDYSINTAVNFEANKATIKKFDLANIDKSNYQGKLTGNGKFLLKGFFPEEMEVRVNGSLPVLSDKSRLANPSLYGDLFVQTRGDLVYTMNINGAYIKGSVLIKDADIIYSNEQSSYDNSKSDFKYSFVIDSSKIDYEQIRFNELLEAAKKEEEQKQKAKNKIPDLDFDFEVTIQNQANVIFMISKGANQKLNLDLTGSFLFSKKSGKTRSQGEFVISPGSTLDLIKTFDAEGSLRFESDIADPYLNIIATYQSEYIPPNSEPEEVAVKLKIKGPFSELGKNLSSNPENIAVYKGRSNIENNISDPRYDAADAFAFILTGKFKDSGTLFSLDGNLSNLATNSLLGTVFTTVANTMLGNLINNIQVKDSGDKTRYSISGKYKNIKYTFGGRTQEFGQILNDIGLNNTEIKIEYFISPKLIFRLENKLPIINYIGNEELVKELGIKYKFEF